MTTAAETIAEAPQTKAGQLFAERRARRNELDAQEEALMAPIRKQIEDIRNLRGSLSDEYNELLGAALREFSFEDLLDPFKAMEFYAASWNDGLGVSNSDRIYADLFGESYVMGDEVFAYNEDGAYEDHLYYLAPRIGIPAKKDEEKLARTAEMIAAVHFVNMEIVGERAEAKIDVFDDGLSEYDSYSIVFDESTKEWELQGRYGRTIRTDSKLIELLRVIPTYC